MKLPYRAYTSYTPFCRHTQTWQNMSHVQVSCRGNLSDRSLHVAGALGAHSRRWSNDCDWDQRHVAGGSGWRWRKTAVAWCFGFDDHPLKYGRGYFDRSVDVFCTRCLGCWEIHCGRQEGNFLLGINGVSFWTGHWMACHTVFSSFQGPTPKKTRRSWKNNKHVGHIITHSFG